MTFAVRQLVHGALQAAETAGLVGLPAGVTSLVLAVVALRKPIEGADADLARGWARTLARQIETGEGAVRRQLLGADTERINLAYVLHPAGGRVATALQAGRTFTNATPAGLPDVLGYYRSTRPRRLVITGAAGAGKTLLALELMLALLEDRTDDDPVPVRIPLAQWDTSRPLSDLLAQRLVAAYDWPPALAAGLVGQGLVLPVLDGLDEMDPFRDDGTPDPDAPRALAALEALNAYQDGRGAGPLVLTCRNNHYDALAPALQLIDAARVAIAPVDTEHAVSYLCDRARDMARWQPLLNHLQAHSAGPLAAALSTPWRLCLAATVYHRTGSPAELLDHPTAHDLDQHLLARYIPATTANTPNPRAYRPDQIHRWLRHLTHHLDGGTTGTPATDLTLYRLWPLAGLTHVRTTDALLTTLTVLLALPLALTTQYPSLAAFVMTVLALVSGALAFRTTAPHRLSNLRQGDRRRTLRKLAAGLAAGLMFGLALGVWTGLALGRANGTGTFWLDLAAGLAYGLFTGLAGGLVVGLAGGLATGLGGEPSTVASPQTVILDDLIYGLVVALLYGLATGLMGLLVFRYADPLTAGLAFGISGALMGGLSFGCPAARRYGVFLLCSRGHLPFRLARFLDWAVTAGLLRYSGPAYQFRHRELQQWLSPDRSRPAPRPSP
ncbi:NACHT domain-containing protein [Streptomyces sp. NPDC047081]|uniref:NACHT domain-containing protein n=1 Tax=Streptomyces sp. NPDC047081 TaxID=3154706 RepID=UPI00340698BD